MAKGTWNEKDRPTIPGFYNRFKTKAKEAVNGLQGVLAMPVKANWGEVGKVVSINSLKELEDAFGKDSNYTAYKLGRLALLGNVKELLLYRLTDGQHKTGTIKLLDTDATEAIKLDTKYPTSRAFNVTIKSNILDANKKDLILFEGAKQLLTIGLKGTQEEIINSINNNLENDYVVASKVNDSTAVLEAVVNQPLTGGNDGSKTVTNESYIKALEELERYEIDSFALDGVNDEILQETVKAWVLKSKEQGNDFTLFTGAKENQTVSEINEKSKSFNHENIVNVGNSGIYEGIKYTPAEVAVYIASLAASQNLKGSICNAKTIFEDVAPKLSATEVKACLAAGTLVLDTDDKDVVVVDDVNTFKLYSDDKDKRLGYIRLNNILNRINKDTALKRKDFVGQVPNDDTSQISVICALKQYFETLITEGVFSEVNVEIDTELQAKADPDELFWKWDAVYVETMKRIYGTGYVR